MLLVITQKVDREDHTLGFMIGWLRALASDYQSVLVICLEQGKFNLPSNVKVRSLGKETGRSHAKYLFRFSKYLWQERRNYQRVLVHMNQEYVLLAGWWWRLTGKKIWLWRNHRYGNLGTRLAVALAHRVFCTSRDAYTAPFAKTEIMPVGIDTSLFKPNPLIGKVPNSFLYLGRLAKVKKIELLINSLVILDREGHSFTFDLVGDFADGDDHYEQTIKKLAEPLMRKGKINFWSGVSHRQTADFYNRHQLLINLTASGSFDKVILEAMSCGTLVLVANNALSGVLPSIFLVTSDEPAQLAGQIKAILRLPVEQMNEYGRNFRQSIVNNHSLPLLISRLR